jgi:hypothetical protein
MNKFLSPKEALRAIELARSPYRPKEILELKEQIDAEVRAGELRASVTGVIGEELVQKIVEMKLRLDGLYADWVQGKLS